jgi:hypothetical protein
VASRLYRTELARAEAQAKLSEWWEPDFYVCVSLQSMAAFGCSRQRYKLLPAVNRLRRAPAGVCFSALPQFRCSCRGLAASS